jgi:hypothetical protein
MLPTWDHFDTVVDCSAGCINAQQVAPEHEAPTDMPAVSESGVATADGDADEAVGADADCNVAKVVHEAEAAAVSPVVPAGPCSDDPIQPDYTTGKDGDSGVELSTDNGSSHSSRELFTFPEDSVEDIGKHL